MKTRMLPRSPFPSRHRPVASSPTSASPSTSQLLGSPPADPTRGPGPSGPTDQSGPRSDRRSGRDSDRIASAMRKVNSCACCLAPATHAVAWVPTPTASKRLGAPAGKTRVVVVGVCASCQALPNAMDRIEEAMFAEAAAGLARPESN